MPASTTEVGTIPVVEVFGPTIQGEGALAGLPTHFVRLGYCDFRCSWCDSMYAVEPDEVSKHSERLTETDVLVRLRGLPAGPRWVTISGGNPAIHDLGPLVVALHEDDYRIAVETQGSYWRPWLADVDLLTVSPKPPSSGMATVDHMAQAHDFLARVASSERDDQLVTEQQRCLKIVVFDEEDLLWAKRFLADYPSWPAYLSVGTDRPRPLEFMAGSAEVRRTVCSRFKWLAERVAADPDLAHVRVIPQLHVLAWGHARGV